MQLNEIAYAYDTVPWSNWGSEWTKFKVSSETKILIDGKLDTVENLMRNKNRLSFANLSMENKDVTLTLKAVKGELDTTEGRLKLRFNF